MGLLTRIESRQSTSTTDRTSMADRPHTSKKQLDVSVDVGKTLAVLVLAALVLVASLVLYLTKANDTAAGAFFAFGEALVAGGLGISIGEQTGARDAEGKLA